MLVYFPSSRLVNILDAGESSTLMFGLLFVFPMFRMRSISFVRLRRRNRNRLICYERSNRQYS